ncbi:MAG: F0F1 ATP synthase subunit B [Coriobacteriia bacterium]|nr:F0F1 ATP synthase subunit B [Coriobacteriia bacterium]
MYELLFPAAAFAAEGGGEGMVATLGSVYPNPATIWPTWVAFIILFALLYKFAFPAIFGMLDARADRIRESLEKAEETKIEAERLLEDYKKQMAEARGEAAKVIEQGRKVADSMKEEIIAKANEEATLLIAKAHEAMEAEKRAAIAELQGEVAQLSVAVAGKLIGEKLSADDHARLIEQYVAEVGGLNDN